MRSSVRRLVARTEAKGGKSFTSSNLKIATAMSLGAAAIGYSIHRQEQAATMVTKQAEQQLDSNLLKDAANIYSLDDLLDFLSSTYSTKKYENKWRYISDDILARFATDLKTNAALIVIINRDLTRFYDDEYVNDKYSKSLEQQNADLHDRITELNAELMQKITAIAKLETFSDFNHYIQLLRTAEVENPIDKVGYHIYTHNFSHFELDIYLATIQALLANKRIDALLQNDANILKQINSTPLDYTAKSVLFKAYAPKIKSQTKTFESLTTLFNYLPYYEKDAFIESLKSPNNQDKLNLIRSSLTSVTQLQDMMKVLASDTLQRQFLILMGNHRILDTLASKRFDPTSKELLGKSTLLFLDRYANMSDLEKQGTLGSMRSLTMRQ